MEPYVHDNSPNTVGDCARSPGQNCTSTDFSDNRSVDVGTRKDFVWVANHVRNGMLDQMVLKRVALEAGRGETAKTEGDPGMHAAHPVKDMAINAGDTAISGHSGLGRDKKNKRKRCKTVPRFVESETCVGRRVNTARVNDDEDEDLELAEGPVHGSSSGGVEAYRLSDGDSLVYRGDETLHQTNVERNEGCVSDRFPGGDDEEEEEEEEDTSSGDIRGGRFMALNAGPGAKGLKVSGNLFGMMDKIGDRKRYACKDCGRSFNQLRVLTVHQQMHVIRRNQGVGEDESNEENRVRVTNADRTANSDGNVDCSRQGNLPEEEEEKGVEMETFVGDAGREVSIQRTYLQEVSEQHTKGANHVVEIPEKRKRKPKSTMLEEPSADNQGYMCMDCGKVFSLPSFLRRHRIVHTGEKPFACKFCGKCFGQKATCQRHELTHGRNKPFACSECGDGFSSSKRLQKHVKEKHHPASNKATATKRKKKKAKAKKRKRTKPPKDDRKPQEDDIAKSEEAGTVHDATDLRSEHGEIAMEMETTTMEEEPPQQMKEARVYTCPICEKTFLQPSHLTRHSLCHTGEKPFKCKECGKGFTQKSTCARHERSHSGMFLFMCTECGNGFAQKSGLQKHRLIHTGEKPYGCRFCECRFTQKPTCQRHERIHTGEKPYVCQQCGKAFGQSTSLERHVKTHLKPKRVGSTELGKAFGEGSSLDQQVTPHGKPKLAESTELRKAFGEGPSVGQQVTPHLEPKRVESIELGKAVGEGPSLNQQVTPHLEPKVAESTELRKAFGEMKPHVDPTLE